MLPATLTASDHRVRVSAPGFREWMQVVQRPEGDVTLAYSGERLAPDAPPPPPPAVVPVPDAAPVVLPAQVERTHAAHPAARAQHTRPRTIDQLIGTQDPFGHRRR
jgi:hypothetical protein